MATQMTGGLHAMLSTWPHFYLLLEHRACATKISRSIAGRLWRDVRLLAKILSEATELVCVCSLQHFQALSPLHLPGEFHLQIFLVDHDKRNFTASPNRPLSVTFPSMFLSRFLLCLFLKKGKSLTGDLDALEFHFLPSSSFSAFPSLFPRHPFFHLLSIMVLFSFQGSYFEDHVSCFIVTVPVIFSCHLFLPFRDPRLWFSRLLSVLAFPLCLSSPHPYLLSSPLCILVHLFQSCVSSSCNFPCGSLPVHLHTFAF